VGLTALLDRWYYGLWTFPPLRFLHFNITKSLAVFYGTNRPDYYLTEGLPLLLMTALPFAAIALYRGAVSSFRGNKSLPQNPLVDSVRCTLTWMTVFVLSSLSSISHKEARFLYPLLSPLLVLAGLPLAKFLRNLSAWKYVVLLALLFFNIVASIYTTQAHQRGVIDVVDFLRSQHEQSMQAKDSVTRTTVAFLMPCHSTPWRSHLIYPEIDAWALACEPPLNVPLNLRSSYVDEADMFYANPIVWLKTQMEDVNMRFSHGDQRNATIGQQARNVDGRVIGNGRRWPDYLVTFAGLETTLKVFLEDTPYQVCKRLFNSHAHDDWRRKGDVVVWCLN
jgi:phosphatidylinositol glycan class B